MMSAETTMCRCGWVALQPGEALCPTCLDLAETTQRVLVRERDRKAQSGQLRMQNAELQMAGRSALPPSDRE